VSAYPRLKEDIRRILDDVVCTKHPPEYDEENVAERIIAAAEKYMVER
jgi:hypothetical protein